MNISENFLLRKRTTSTVPNYISKFRTAYGGRRDAAHWFTKHWSKLHVGMLASGHWLKKPWSKQCDGATQQSLLAAGRDCYVVPSHCLFHYFLSQWPLASIPTCSLLCKPVTSIPTSLSFLSLFQSWSRWSMKLYVGGTHVRTWLKMPVTTTGRTNR